MVILNTEFQRKQTRKQREEAEAQDVQIGIILKALRLCQN